MTAQWTQVADRVFVLRYPTLDVNSTLIVGEEGAVLVDTLSTARQAAQLRDAVSRITHHHPVLVNTHHHFDHCFGNATLRGAASIWAHPRCIELLGHHGERLRHAAGDDHPELATELADVAIDPPDRPVSDSAVLGLGDRSVLLRYLGRGHTDDDLVVLVPDADVIVAGDLVESGAPPAFHDSWPLEWPATVAELLALTGPATTVIPGHGSPVDAAFVRTQHAELAQLEWLCREGHRDSAPPEEVATRSPFGAQASLPAVRRAYADLDGHL